jgi:hypothetical protein
VGYFLFFVLALAAILFINPRWAMALSGSDWKAGRIIDDFIFINKDSISVAQIQTFLKNSILIPKKTTNSEFRRSRRNLHVPSKSLIIRWLIPIAQWLLI